jgi:preprotein translocase subunit SecG
MFSLQTFLFIVQIVLSVLIILCVLLQQTDNDSLSGIGGGNGNAQMLSKRSMTTPMSKFTMVLFILFMLNSMLLATFSARGFDKNKNISIESLVDTKK